MGAVDLQHESLTQVGTTTAIDGLTDTRVDAANYRVCVTIPRLGKQWGESGDLYAPVRSLALPKPPGAPYDPPSFRVAIGNDTLRSCVFTYNDPPEWFVLDYLGD